MWELISRILDLLKESNHNKDHRASVLLIFKCWLRFTVASAAIPVLLFLSLTPSNSAQMTRNRETMQEMVSFSQTKSERQSTTFSTSCQVTVLRSRIHHFPISTPCKRLFPHGGHHLHHSRRNSPQSRTNLDPSPARPNNLNHQGAYLSHHLVYEDYSRYKTDKEVNESKEVSVLRNGRL